MWRYKWYIYSVRWRCHVSETEKILVFHWQPYCRYYQDIANVTISKETWEFFFSTSSFVSNFVCFREIFAGFDIDKSYLTNRFQVAVRLFSNRSQMTSKRGKNKKVAHEAQPSVSLMFLPHFDVLCDLLLNRCTATWNLFVLYIKELNFTERKF